MQGYVRWRTGQEFGFLYPLSIIDLRRLFARHFAAGCRILMPELWAEDIRNFQPLKRFAARLYNLTTRFNVSRAALTFVAPFFRVVARKPDAGAAHDSERQAREVAS